MVNIKFEELSFDHIVEFTKDSTVFAAARELDSGNLKLFLVHEHTGNVYTRNGRSESWEELFDSKRYAVIARILNARNNHVPVYRVNGTHQ
jgi:hypothetical protein